MAARARIVRHPASELAPVARPHTRPPMALEVEIALTVALHALYQGHHVVCDGMSGNVFARALADIERLTGLMPGSPGPYPDVETLRFEISRRG